MKYIKYMLIFILTLSISFASDNNDVFTKTESLNQKTEYDYPYKDFVQVISYVKNFGGVIDFDIATKLNTDLNWLKGNDYLTNRKYKKDLTSDSIKRL